MRYKRREATVGHLRNGEDDEEVEEEPFWGLEVPHHSPPRRLAVVVLRRLPAEGDLEVEPHVPHMQRVRHAPEGGDGESEPAVDEQAHPRAADRQRVEEERVEGQPRCADQQECPVPFPNPPPPLLRPQDPAGSAAAAALGVSSGEPLPAVGPLHPSLFLIAHAAAGASRESANRSRKTKSGRLSPCGATNLSL